MDAPTNTLDFRARFQTTLGSVLAIVGDDTVAEDARLWYDLLDGETPALDELRAVVRCVLDTEALDAALGKRIEAMQTRRARYKQAAERCRALVRDCLGDARQSRLDAEDFTAFVRPGAPAVKVADPTCLPRGYSRVTIEPNKTAIRQAWKNGEAVVGAEQGDAVPVLTIRVA